MRPLEVALPVKQPELRVSIGGIVLAGVVSLTIDSVGYFSADRFRVVFAVGSGSAFSMDYFASLGMQTITVEAAVNGFGYHTLLVGQIDNIRIDIASNVAILSGRDLAARLIDAEIFETFVNQTASQIVETIAERHGLTPSVTTTTVPVGQYYELDHARSALGVNARATTAWNLLTMLAQAEGFVLSVIGTTLNFGPWPITGLVTVMPSDFMKLSIDLATALPAGTTVKSWSCRNKSVISKSDGTGAGTTIIRPNLTQEQAQSLAEYHVATLGQHGTILTGLMPGDVTLRPGMKLMLKGASSLLDQQYVVTSICRSLDGMAGFKQIVRAYALN